MLTREISDNKTLTVKSSYPMEYQAAGKSKRCNSICTVILTLTSTY